jgi:hypothetical protein
MLILQPLLTHLPTLRQRWRQVALLLCLLLAAFPAIFQAQAARAISGQPVRALYQSSTLSLLQQPMTTTVMLTGPTEIATAAPGQGNSTSLVLVALVLLGIVSVVGIVLWRQR